MRFAAVPLILLACAPSKPAQPYPSTLVPDPGPEPQPPQAKPADAASAEGVVHYFDRAVDLRPFLVGFPYGRFRPSLRTNTLFYLSLGDEYRLRSLPIGEAGAAWKLADGATLGDIDWSKRSLWSIHHHEPSHSLWLHADASNDEVMNLWRLELPSAALTQLTHADYVYGLGFSADETRVAYLPRTGKTAPFRSCLRIREVTSGNERELLCDEPKLTFTWSDIRFSPDGRDVFFQAQIDGDRNRVQLVRVDTRASNLRAQVLTDRKAKRSDLEILEGWVDGELFYRANDDGFTNLYGWSQRTGRARKITSFNEDLTSAHLTEHGIIGVHRTPAGSTLVLVDPVSGRVTAQQSLPGSAGVEDGWGARAIVAQRSPDTVFEAFDVAVEPARLGLRPVASLEPTLEKQVVACRATAVNIPTFDIDPKTGNPRLLHAFLLEPREPLPEPAHRLAMVTAFYGGENSYSKFDQIMCAAGLTVLSPSVRGSTGFGRDFHALNDKDLGGNEIVDLFWAAKWLEARTGLGPRRIGVYGGSHGGYATMRALTFGPTTADGAPAYPFGFGMAHAGFSDIKHFYDATNIPDWVVLESGDPKIPAELQRMKDRSPLQHPERLMMPLLLTHGSQDWRVPVEESRRFAAAAKAQGRPVTYVEFEGQGHHIEGLALEVRLYQARFDFLRAVAQAATRDEK